MSERRACAVLRQHRSTQRKPPRGRDDEAALTADIIELAKAYGCYGYRRITALLRAAGWAVNAKRLQRIWRLEGLKVPQKQPKRGRLWLNDGSCARLRAERPNQVWFYDFVEDLRDELLNGELLFSLAEAQVLIEAWRRHFNAFRPHSSLKYRPPAPETITPRRGTVVPRASAPAVEGARSPTPTMASANAVH